MHNVYLQISITAALVLLFFITRAVTNKIIVKHALGKDIGKARIFQIKKYFNFIWIVLFATLIVITWDVSFQWLSVYFASFFAVAGIALFASWSMLSNITASVILYFNYPFRIGSNVKILDGENSVTGMVTDITLFSIKIKTPDGNLVNYPNNLAIQKPIIQIRT